MTNQEKLEALKAHLIAKTIPYWEDVRVAGKDVVIPVFIPKGRIVVRIGEDEMWYRALRKYTHPVIIRDLDTSAFVIEKVENTIKAKTLKKGRRPRTFTPNQRKRHNKIARFCKSLEAESKVVVVVSF